VDRLVSGPVSSGRPPIGPAGRVDYLASSLGRVRAGEFGRTGGGRGASYPASERRAEAAQGRQRHEMGLSWPLVSLTCGQYPARGILAGCRAFVLLHPVSWESGAGGVHLSIGVLLTYCTELCILGAASLVGPGLVSGSVGGVIRRSCGACHRV
jgi:hypothetical protein